MPPTSLTLDNFFPWLGCIVHDFFAKKKLLAMQPLVIAKKNVDEPPASKKKKAFKKRPIDVNLLEDGIDSILGEGR